MIARLWRGIAKDAAAYLRHLDAVRAFAGADPDRAVVEPEARAALAEFDDFVRHYEVER